MTTKPKIDEALRDQILAQPDVVLEDADLMRALVMANDRAMGSNIVDLRGLAMERLEARLTRLEDTHRNVIAAAYENLAGTNQVHRAILCMLDPIDFEGFLRNRGSEVAAILRVDTIRLVLESAQPDGAPATEKLGNVLHVAGPGFVDDYLTGGRGTPVRPVVLRQIREGSTAVYGEASGCLRSEACLRLDFGSGRLPGMLVMGAEDPHQFSPSQGVDLLTFFAGVFERAMRRWLS